MLDLSEAKLNKWVGKLPEDIRGILDTSVYRAESAPLVSALRTSEPHDVLYLLRTHDQYAIEALGRAGRLRLMAWMSDSVTQDIHDLEPSDLFRELLGEDEEEGGGQRSAVSAIFYEDFLAFAKLMGVRSAQHMFSNEMVKVALDAAREVNQEIGFKG